MTNSSFEELGVSEPLRRALAAEGYEQPTPIQALAIPAQLAGRDLLGLAQTGTGKTAAFALPLMQRLCVGHEQRRPRSTRALILAPTRELAIQIDDSLRAYGKFLHLRHAVIVGGVSQGPQAKALAAGLDILVATPGRLLDHVEQKNVSLNAVTELVLDEADRMLDMGFIRDLRRIVALLPRERQSMLFSATMPQDVEHLANSILFQPVRVDVSPPTRAAENIEQRVFHVATAEKRGLLADLLSEPSFQRVLVFTRTKHGANRVSAHLAVRGVDAEAIHGNKSQGARQRALQRFRAGEVRVLVATDIAARGLDIDNISHVINFELPAEVESYIHRIGRTARAGSRGIAISFCDESERDHLRQIEKVTRSPLVVARPAAQPSGAGFAERQRPSRGHRDHRRRWGRAHAQAN